MTQNSSALQGGVLKSKRENPSISRLKGLLFPQGWAHHLFTERFAKASETALAFINNGAKLGSFSYSTPP